MLIFDDIFTWEGWGGKFKLGSGRCRLRIFDLEKGKHTSLRHIRPIVIVAADVPESKMSVRSCSSHIATKVAESFNIHPNRMLFVEYYPAVSYGEQDEHHIPERFDAVDYTWHQGKALHPKWRTLRSPMRDIIKALMQGGGKRRTGSGGLKLQ